MNNARMAAAPGPLGVLRGLAQRFSRLRGGASAAAIMLAAAGLPAAWAQPAVPAPALAPVAPQTEPKAATRAAGEPLAALNVAEDDQVRIEELRVRGESQRITVKPKAAGAREYEISPSTGAQDPSQRNRRPPGTSLWRVLSF